MIDWSEAWKNALEAGATIAKDGGTQAAAFLRQSANAFKDQVAGATEALVSGQIDRQTFDYEIEGCKLELRTAVDRAKIMTKATVQKAVNAIFDSLLKAVVAGIKF